MKINSFTNLAIALLKFINFMTIIMIVLIVFMTFYSKNHPNKFKNVFAKNNYSLEIKFYPSSIEKNEGLIQNSNVLYSYNNINWETKIRIMYFLVISAIISILINVKLIDFFESSQNISTFFKNNSRIFFIIGILLSTKLLYDFILNFIFIFLDRSSQTFNSGRIDILDLFSDFIMVIIAFTASNIFKEGERLRSENDLTV